VHDRAYSSLLQFSRRRFYSYLDSTLWSCYWQGSVSEIQIAGCRN
jgi:hypothetical protein